MIVSKVLILMRVKNMLFKFVVGSVFVIFSIVIFVVIMFVYLLVLFFKIWDRSIIRIGIFMIKLYSSIVGLDNFNVINFLM